MSFSVKGIQASVILKRKVTLLKTSDSLAFPFLNCKSREQVFTVGHAHKLPQLKIQSQKIRNWAGLILSPAAYSCADSLFRDEWKNIAKMHTFLGDQNYYHWELMTFS